MNRKQKIILVRILSAAVIVLAAALIPLSPTIRLILCLSSYLLAGYDVLWDAGYNLLHGELFDENFLMALATVGALILSEYFEALAVMIFYQVGELFQSYAVGKSRRSIADLMDIRPDTAIRVTAHSEETVDPADIAVGETIRIRPGQRIPLDGVIQEGSSSLDTSALTGESIPRDVTVGEEVISGCINLSSTLTVTVTRTYEESTVSKILDLVENASSSKANVENFITRFARYYTPTVVIAALVLAFLPPLFLPGAELRLWVIRALNFLVVSCPCALVISVPLTFFGGIGGAGKCGILIKGSNYLEALSRVSTVVFDKTGTLTQGVFAVTGIHTAGSISPDALLSLAAHVEADSSHPISRSILRSHRGALDTSRVTRVEEVSGQGIMATVDGTPYFAGNSRLMTRAGIPESALIHARGTAVHLASQGKYLGCITLADQPKPDAKNVIASLAKAGVTRTVMLTGDADEIGRDMAESLGIPEVYAQLLPAQKVEILEEILSSDPDKKVAFVGDGINDAPVLARADVGIAMGALGSDAAIEAADVVIMTDEPSRVATAIHMARRTLSIVWQNIIFALSVKILVLILSAVGLASLWAAVFADVGVSVIAICNAMRSLIIKELPS